MLINNDEKDYELVDQEIIRKFAVWKVDLIIIIKKYKQ